MCVCVCFAYIIVRFSVCYVHFWTIKLIAKVEWSENMTLTFVRVRVCVKERFCVAIWSTKGLLKESPWEITFPFSLSLHSFFFSLPVPPSSALFISLRYGSQRGGIFSHCCAPTNHPPSSSSARTHTHTLSPTHFHPHSALTGCLWCMQHIMMVDRGACPPPGGVARPVGGGVSAEEEFPIDVLYPAD